MTRSGNSAQQKALHLFSRGLGGREGPLMTEIYIFCFPIFFPNMSGISENLARPLLRYKLQTNDVPGADIDLEIQLEQQESLTKVISVEEVKLSVDTIDTAKSAAMQNMNTMFLKDVFQAKPEYLCKVFKF